MTRRITRTLVQVGGLCVVLFFLVFLADSRYRVLPQSLHYHLPSHHTDSVITDITISFCSALNPFTSCRLDPDEWHRVEKDLYLNQAKFSSAWLHVKWKREEELTPQDRVVMDMRAGELDPGVGEKGQHNEKWESRPGGLWILRSNKRHDADSNEAVTAVDVLFGADAVDPRPHWRLNDGALALGAGEGVLPARLSVRHGQPPADHKEAAALRVRRNNRFKILQVSDAHLATGTGVCRDAIGPDGAASALCEADTRTLEFIERVLDDEKPDLVVLSGDQVEGPRAPDTQTALFKMVAPLIRRSIPYAAIFGNHDDESAQSLSRAAQMGLLRTLPFSLAEPGPENVDGVGNYYLEVRAPSSEHSALTVYLLDSHSGSPDERRFHGYDWIKPSQIDWFRDTARGLRKAHARYSLIHMDLAFIHIPLPEFADPAASLAGGSFREPSTAPRYNSHFYDALAAEGVVAVGAGHDHVNDHCALLPASAAAADPEDPDHPSHHGHQHRGPWMCYAGGSGFGGYGGYGGFHRRVRVWEVDTVASRVTTWKRVECCGDAETKRRVDELVVVEGGVVVTPAE